jgi:hypothetical protein
MIVFIAIGIPFIFDYILRSITHPQPPPLTTEELLAKSKEPLEVQVFFGKYPNASTSFTKGSEFWVEHTILKSVHEGKPIDTSNATAHGKDSYLQMWVIMGEKNGGLKQISLICHGGDVIYNQNGTGWTREHHFQINDNITSFLQEGKEEYCFD